MKISENGIRLIKSFEGYHKRLPDGRCVAYQCPARVWTLGYGCTKGIKPGMMWTEAEAEAALMSELGVFEAGVNLATEGIALNQNEFDALVSFSYNCGLSALNKSSILKKLKAGDRIGAANAFHAWNKGGGRVLPGLVARRAREAALFLKPVSAPESPAMPQQVSENAAPAIDGKAVVGAGVGAGGAVAVPSLPVPPVPETVTESLNNVSQWQTIGTKLWNLPASFAAKPLASLAILLAIAAVWLGPWAVSRLRGR